MAPVNSHGPEANTALQGMVAAVQLASMEATYTGMMKTVATLMENKIQFKMGTMIAIPEFIIAAEVMLMLMNRCFFSKNGIFPLLLWWFQSERAWNAQPCSAFYTF